MADQTQAPSTPTQEQTPSPKSASEFVNLPDEAFMQMLGIKPDTPTPEAETPKPEIKPAPVEAVKPEPEVAVEAEPEATAEPEKEPEPEKPKKSYNFQVFDEQGELEVPEDVVVTFKANDKVREKVPLEKVIKFAEMGVYNHEREQAFKQREVQAEQAVQTQRHLEAVVNELTTQVKRMLEDRDYAEAARERYLEYHAPENVAHRARQETEQLKQDMRARDEAQLVAQATQAYITPVVDALLQRNAQVSQYEVLGRFQELVAPYLVNGRLPASRLNSVVQLVNNDLTAWVESVQDERATKESERAKVLEAEKREAQAMKRKLARAVAPTASAAPPVESGQPKNYKSAKDWLNAAFPV